jgi:hypothetical protein
MIYAERVGGALDRYDCSEILLKTVKPKLATHKTAEEIMGVRLGIDPIKPARVNPSNSWQKSEL